LTIERIDLVIIGGGMAGLSVAAEYAEFTAARADPAGRPRPTIAVLERENQLAYHTTGRSAAAFLESYGGPEIRALTRASRPILDAIGASSGTALLRSRPMVWTAGHENAAVLEMMLDAIPTLRRIDLAGARTLCSALRPEYLAAAAVERTAQDIDVDALFQQYRRRALDADVQIRASVGIESGEYTGDGWHLVTDRGELLAGTVVNAGGAWADAIATRLGVAPMGLQPFRRTVAIVSVAVPATWPLVSDAAERFYFRPESGGLLISPADETPSPPCDARAEPLDVALALERVNEATTLDLRHVRTSWAGLRTFAPDRNPVVGFDPISPAFFWLAGQGGYGIQIAAALGVLAAALLAGDKSAGAVEDLDPDRLSPARLHPPR
jgi:D-arginine dehydrogenase